MQKSLLAESYLSEKKSYRKKSPTGEKTSLHSDLLPKNLIKVKKLISRHVTGDFSSLPG